jgi:hypothetical protein
MSQLCELTSHSPEDGSSMFLRNTGIYPHVHTEFLSLRRTATAQEWEPQVSYTYKYLCISALQINHELTDDLWRTRDSSPSYKLNRNCKIIIIQLSDRRAYNLDCFSSKYGTLNETRPRNFALKPCLCLLTYKQCSYGVSVISTQHLTHTAAINFDIKCIVRATAML